MATIAIDIDFIISLRVLAWVRYASEFEGFLSSAAVTAESAVDGFAFVGPVPALIAAIGIEEVNA
jgi:hypothetical protein